MKRSPDLVTLLQALGDPTRLRLLNLLRAGELCVCYLVEVLGDPQPKISRHLAYLRRAGVVEVRRDGKWMHYRLVKPVEAALTKVLDAALNASREERQMQRDRGVLEKACCAVKLPATLANAPRPHLRS